MNRSMLERLTPLFGLAFVALLSIVIFGLSKDQPDSTASTAKVVSYWTANHSKETGASVLGALAAVLLIWFAAGLRSHLRRAEGEPGALAAAAFGGFLVAAVGGLIFAAFNFAAADVATHVPADVPASTLQAVSLLGNDFFFPLAGGLGVALVATGVATLQHGPLPRWLGAVAIVIGIAAMSPLGPFAQFAALLWVVVASILLHVRRPRTAP